MLQVIMDKSKPSKNVLVKNNIIEIKNKPTKQWVMLACMFPCVFFFALPNIISLDSTYTFVIRYVFSPLFIILYLLFMIKMVKGENSVIIDFDLRNIKIENNNVVLSGFLKKHIINFNEIETIKLELQEMNSRTGATLSKWNNLTLYTKQQHKMVLGVFDNTAIEKELGEGIRDALNQV